MTIGEGKYADSVSPKDTSLGTFEPLSNTHRVSWTLNKKLCTRDQRSTYGKLASFQFPKEGISTRDNTAAPSLYSSVSSSPSVGEPSTPRGSVVSYNHTHVHLTAEQATPSPPRRGAYYTHRRSSPLSLSSDESIFNTHPAQSPTTTFNSFVSERQTPTTPSEEAVEPKRCHVAYSPTLLQPPLITHQTEPLVKAKKVAIRENRVRRHSAQARHSALPLPIIDLDVVSQPLIPRSMNEGTARMVTKLGRGLERFSLSSGSTVDDIGIAEPTDGEDGLQEDEEMKDVSIVDFLRESMSPRAMSTLGHEPVSMGELVDVSRVLGAPLQAGIYREGKC